MFQSVWLAWISSCFVMLIGGAVYGFSSYAPDIKSIKNWTQPDIELVGELLHVGVYLGPVTGILAQLFKDSPYVNFTIAGICSALGYFLAGTLLENSNPSLLAFLFLMIGFGSGLVYNVALTVNVMNFSKNKKKGIVVGVLVSAFGFGAIVFSALYNVISGTEAFLKYMGLIFLILAIQGAIFIRISKEKEGVTEPLMIESQNTKEEKEQNVPLIERVKIVFRCILRIGKTSIFWIMFAIFSVGTGCGLMYINNVGSFIHSMNMGELGKDEVKAYTQKCISFLSIANGVGRILMGFSDYSKLKRSYFLLIALSFMCLAQLLNALVATNVHVILYTAMVVGLAYGMIWSITPTLVSEIFDAGEFGLIWGWFGLAPTIGSVILNSIAGQIYESNTEKGSNDCFGKHCYFASFMINAGAALIGVIISILAIRRTSERAVAVEETNDKTKEEY